MVTANPEKGMYEPSKMVDALWGFFEAHGTPSLQGAPSAAALAATGTAAAPVNVVDDDDDDDGGADGGEAQAGSGTLDFMDEQMKVALAMSLAEHAQSAQNTPPMLSASLQVGNEAEDAKTPSRGASPMSPAVEMVDLAAYFAPEGAAPADMLRLRIKLPSGPWNLSMLPTTPLLQFVAGIKTKLREGGGDVGLVDLLVGFPPRKIFEDAIVPAVALHGVTLAQVSGLRTGDVVTPHCR
jgi:hypothetical protein